MSNFEKLKPPLEPEPNPEEFKEIIELTKEIENKIIDIKKAIAQHEADDSLLISLNELEKDHVALVDQYGNSPTQEPVPVTIIETPEPAPVPSEQKLVDQYKNVITPDENGPVQILDAFGQPIEQEKPVEQTIEITEAELVAARIKKAREAGEEPSPEDTKYRTEHWPEVEAAFINLHKPKPVEAAPAAAAVAAAPAAKTESKPEPKPATKPEAKTASVESAPKARIEKAKKEQDTKTEKALENKDEKTKKRTKKVIEKVKAKKEEERLHWLYYAGMVPAAPTAAGVWLGNKAADAINDTISLLKEKFKEGMNPSKKGEKKDTTTTKEKIDEKKSKREKLREKFGTKEKRQPTEEELNALEEKEAKEEALAAKKKEFLEKAFDGKLEGENLKQWEKTSKVSIGTFFDPSRMGKTLDDYKPWQKVLFEKLEPIYKKEPAETTSEHMTLGDFVTQLIEKDKLKDIWNPPSETSS